VQVHAAAAGDLERLLGGLEYAGALGAHVDEQPPVVGGDDLGERHELVGASVGRRRVHQPRGQPDRALAQRPVDARSHRVELGLGRRAGLHAHDEPAHRRVADEKAVELITELSKICDDKTTAVVLNRLGYRTGQGKTWRVHHVQNVRSYMQTAGGTTSRTKNRTRRRKRP
jgi:hypothetical protein